MIPTHTRRGLVRCMTPLAGVVVVACGPTGGGPTASGGPGQNAAAPAGAFAAWPAEDRWPAAFQRAPQDVQEAYRYAVANAGVLQYIPCYCGCIDDGHTSNWDCYVREVRPDGSVVLDPMSFG